MRSNVIFPASLLLIRVPDGTQVHDTPVSSLVAVAVETNARMSRDQRTTVVWYLPDTAPVENFRGGKKKQILDIFGPWASIHDVTVTHLKECRLPQPVVAISQVLECNFELSEAETLPYDVC